MNVAYLKLSRGKKLRPSQGEGHSKNIHLRGEYSMETLTKSIPVQVRFKDRFVTIGQIEGNTFKRSCRSDQLYRAMGGSLGVDDAVMKELEKNNVKKLKVTVKDWIATYCIDFQKFKRLAKPRQFYGEIRWHLPFNGYWSKEESAED